MEKIINAVATATKNQTPNAATTAAKTATTATAAGLKTTAEKQETPKAEAKPAAPAAPAAPATTPVQTKTEQPAAPTTTPAQTKTEQPAAPATQKDENTAKVEAFAAELKRKQSLAEMQQQIDEELQRLNHKKEVADKRNVFLTCSGKIDEYLKLLKQEEQFETNLCRLSFEIFEKDNYGRENFKNFMAVSNTEIVTKFCNLLKEEIAAKVTELETELLKA